MMKNLSTKMALAAILGGTACTMMRQHSKAEKSKAANDKIDAASEDSFPASDAPAWTKTTV